MGVQFAEDQKFTESQEHLQGVRQSRNLWFRGRRLVMFAVAVVVAIAVAVGTGVGLTRSRNHHDDVETSPPIPTNSTTVNNTRSLGMWQPQAGLTWNIQLGVPLNASNAAVYGAWDVDLFDTSKETINSMQNRGSKIICYFSAGSSEHWRPDFGNFTSSDLGADMKGWPGEKWLNVSSPNVRSIMLARLDMAVAKNCDAVDPDNMDGYNNVNGLGLTSQNAIDYITFLAGAANQRNLAIGLKNAGEILSSVVNVVQFSVNEACAAYKECSLYAPMIQHTKPVFHIEYPKGPKVDTNQDVSTAQKNSACNADSETGFSTVMKNSNLDAWSQFCFVDVSKLLPIPN